MNNRHQSTEAYKGVRDFYPEDMAIQSYIFETWAKTAERFGYARYDASILEPADLYKAKGAENEEMVNEQTYTFIDRGGREVTLRPEMTPTVARLVAGRRRELAFPVRWYSIPNLFRYERPQRGRLREHWQLNCDLFGADDYTADVEIIALASQTMIDFGAKPEMFEIRINNKSLAFETVKKIASLEGEILEPEQVAKVIRLMDREAKMSPDEYYLQMSRIVPDDVAKELCREYSLEDMSKLMKGVKSFDELLRIGTGLELMGIKTRLDSKLVRGFDYYTGTIFEIFEVDKKGNTTGRSLLGGGRYDNLTTLFSDDPISGVGFGMGDVTMRDFLTTHKLLPKTTKAPTVMVIPMEAEQNLAAQKVAQQFRASDISTETHIGTKKVGKKISDASERSIQYVLVVGEDEVVSQEFTLKRLSDGQEVTGPLSTLIDTLTN